MTDRDRAPLTRKPEAGRPAGKSDARLDRFLAQVAATPKRAAGRGSRGRLIFAMDATASREPSWDRAMHLQGEMFAATAGLGGLEVQLVFYRGFGECKASRWVADSRALLRTMTGVRCLGGQTQIGRVLGHAIKQARTGKVDALVFVGDAFEEDIDAVCRTAGELGLLGVPAFMFQEGGDPIARRAFEQIATLTKGAWCPFDSGSADQLRALLGAVAAYAAGGYQALEAYGRSKGGDALRLTHQVRR